MDVSATEPQGTVLAIMLVTFAVTLPGRAPVLLTATSAALALPMVRALAGAHVGFDVVFAFVPSFLAAVGGRSAGRLLDTAAARLWDAPSEIGWPWTQRALSTRVLLAVGLLGIAAAGFPSVLAGMKAESVHAPAFVAIVWQVMTLLGWIGFTPLLVDTRGLLAARTSASGAALTLPAVARHVALVAALATLHAVGVVAIAGMLAIPVGPDWSHMVWVAATLYLPLDLLAYLTIRTLVYSSDAERHRRDSTQRERALRAESLDSRLAALRARLNPHFLFNALNSVAVLARAGRTEETGRLVDGLTSTLRYVLDDRRASVSLREEMDFARQYLGIQQVRLGDRLRVEIDVSDECDEALVPQLLVQPIVENAVEHGVSRTLDGGAVRLSAARVGSDLRITVDDDGPGPSGPAHASGIGLASTRERLRHLYGARASLTIEARADPGPGTRVRITLPFEVHGPTG